jgi:hypothetical protein
MQPFERNSTAGIQGNKLYQDLAAKVSAPFLAWGSFSDIRFSTRDIRTNHGVIGTSKEFEGVRDPVVR